MEYIINIELNGKLYKTIKSKKDFQWDKLESIEEEIKSLYKGEKHIRSCSSGSNGYYIGFQEKEGITFCYRWKTIEVTDFKDCNGNKLCIGDKLIKARKNPGEDEIIYELHQCSLLGKDYYIRYYYSRPGVGLCWKDISNITQNIIDDYKFVKYNE